MTAANDGWNEINFKYRNLVWGSCEKKLSKTAWAISHFRCAIVESTSDGKCGNTT